MNRARIKLLISDLKSAEKEILLGDSSITDREALRELKAAVDDFRLSIWAALMHSRTGAKRHEYVQSVRMARVVEMLRQIRRGRDENPCEPHLDGQFSFSELVRVAEDAITRANGCPN
jgi:hypothetical protein